MLVRGMNGHKKTKKTKKNIKEPKSKKIIKNKTPKKTLSINIYCL
jgi:hypothetical protein